MSEVLGAGVVLAEPVGLPVEVDDDGAVQEPVEHGRGDGGVAEDLAPRSHAPVGGEDDAGIQVPQRHDLEQGVRCSAGSGM